MENKIVKYIQVAAFKGKKFSTISEALENTSVKDIAGLYKGEDFNKVSNLMKETYDVECSISLEDMKLVIPMTSQIVKDYTDSDKFINLLKENDLDIQDFEL